MKTRLLIVLVASLLAACGTTKKPEEVDAPKVTAIGNQQLKSEFKRRGIKIEYGCAWGTGMFGISDAMCSKTDLKAIEVTAYAPSFGNSEVLRENAFRVAEDLAKAKLSRFLNEEIQTSSVTRTISKNIEKANDRIKQRITGEEVVMSEEDASKDTNYAIRENTNNTTREFVDTVRNQSQTILRGVTVVDEKIVDRQTVQVTIRWDHNTNNAARELRRIMRK